MIWEGDRSGVFSVKSFYLMISNYSIPWKAVWKAKVPSKVVFFYFFYVGGF